MKQMEDICTIAQKERGTKEAPANSNRIKYNTWYYGRDVSGPSYPWCMVFMQWLAYQISLPVLKTASCTALANWAKERAQWITKDFQKGDWVEFDFSGRRKITEHIGLVVDLYPGGVVTVEGNTASGNDTDGGQVQLRRRPLSLITGAWHPPYEDAQPKEEEPMVKRYHAVKEIPDAFRPIILELIEIGVLNGYGSEEGDPNNLVVDLSHDMVRMFVCNHRAGTYDRALLAAGKAPAVSP